MTKGTVLVVDNDDTTHSIVADILQQAGYGVVRAYDAVSALCVLAALCLDAVVASSNVPGMEGTALLRVMHDLAPELPLIFLTDHPYRDTEALAAAQGASSYFCKPFDPEALSRMGLDALSRRWGQEDPSWH